MTVQRAQSLTAAENPPSASNVSQPATRRPIDTRWIQSDYRGVPATEPRWRTWARHVFNFLHVFYLVLTIIMLGLAVGLTVVGGCEKMNKIETRNNQR